jgi:signal transduction histidine kinase
MTFRSQLIVGNIALLVIAIVTGTAAVFALGTTSTQFEQVARDLATDVIAAQRVRFLAEQLVATSRGYLLTGDPKTLERFTDASARLDASLARLRRRADLAEDVARIEQVSRTYVTAAEQAARRRTATGDPQTIIPFFETTLAPSRDRFEAAIDRFVARAQEDFDRGSQRSQRFATRTQDMIAIATSIGIVLSICLAGISIRRLSVHYAREQEATAAARKAAGARDELLAIVSHDLRNPLATVAMGTHLLDETMPGPHVRKHLAAIGNAVGRMQHLIEELLDVASLDNGTLELHPEPCDAAELLDSALSLFQARALEAHLELVVEPCANLTVCADRERVSQVLSNLVGNALKFTPAHGRITLSARPCDGHVRFAVRDTGCGIAGDHLPHLFERYWQGRPRRGSLGLGLYICRQLIEAHRGRLEVTSRPTEGSTFSFTLPIGS